MKLKCLENEFSTIPYKVKVSLSDSLEHAGESVTTLESLSSKLRAANRDFICLLLSTFLQVLTQLMDM